jgi:acetyl-CoA acetyltransferase
VTDGAAALLVASRRAAEANGIPIEARLVDWAVVGVEPAIMGAGPTERELGIPRDRTNLYGGGISIGHPPGATGLRMTITAMHPLRDTGGRYAVVSMCLGSGMGMATLIENLAR